MKTNTKKGQWTKGVTLVLAVFLMLISASSLAFANFTFVGDSPNGKTIEVLAYSGVQTSPCDGVVGAGDLGSLYWKTGIFSGNNIYDANDDYNQTFVGASGPYTVHLYICSSLGSEEVDYSLLSVNDGDILEIDWGYIQSTAGGSNAATFGDNIYICNERDGTRLDSVNEATDAGDGSYDHYYVIDNGDATSSADDTISAFALLDNDFSAECILDSSVTTAKRINTTTTTPDNFGVFAEFEPNREVTGDLHVDLGNAIFDVITEDDSFSVGMVNQSFSGSSPDGIDNGDNDLILYYDQDAADDYFVKILSTLGLVETISSEPNAFSNIDLVVRVNGTVPATISEVRATISGVEYSVVPSGLFYELYLPDFDSATAVDIEFAETAGGSDVFTKSITIDNNTVAGDQDQTINVGRLHGETHTSLESGASREIEVYNDSLCTNQVSEVARTVQATEDNTSDDYQVYYENDGSGTFYSLTRMDNGNTFDSCGNGYTFDGTDHDNVADLELEVTGTTQTDVDRVEIDYDQSVFSTEDVWTTDFTSGEYHLFGLGDSDSTGDVVFYNGAGTQEVLTIERDLQTTSDATATVDVAKVTGDIDAGFDTGSSPSVFVYDSYPGTPLNSLFFTTNGSSVDNYSVFFDATASEQDGLVDVYFEDDSSSNEFTVRLDVDSDPTENDYTDSIVGGDEITLDMTNTLTGSLPISVNSITIAEYNTTFIRDVVELTITGTWPHTYTLYYDTTSGINFHVDAYDELLSGNATQFNVLSRNVATASTSALPATFDVARVVGEAHDNLESGDDVVHIFSDSSCTTQVSSVDRNPIDDGYTGGSNDYVHYFEHTGGSSYYVESTMNDGNDTFATCGNELSAAAGATATAHDITVEKFGTAFSGTTRVGIDLNQDLTDDAFTDDFNASNFYRVFTLADSDTTADVNYYDPALFLTLEDDLSVAESSVENSIARVVGVVPTDFNGDDFELELSSGDGCGGSFDDDVTVDTGASPWHYELFFNANDDTYDVVFCNGATLELLYELDTTGMQGGDTAVVNASRLSGEAHSNLENAGDGADDVAIYRTQTECLNALNELSSQTEQPSDDQYGADDYRQFYVDNGSGVYYANYQRNTGSAYDTCHEFTSTGPASQDALDVLFEVGGTTHADVGGAAIDIDNDGTDEVFTQGFPSDTYFMYSVVGQTDSNVTFFDSLVTQTVYLVREKDISSGSGSDQTVNVGRVTGETYTDLENAGSRIEVYGVFDNITGVISDLRSSEIVQPSDVGGVDYTQYFEAAQSSFDATNYSLRALGNSSGTIFETTGNLFTTSSLAATVDLVTDKGGTVVDEITRVAIDYDQDGVDEASTDVDSNEYHLWTTTDGDGVDISFYDGSNNKLFETSLSSLSAGLVDVDVSAVEGIVPTNFNGEMFEIETGAGDGCGGSFHDNATVGAQSYVLYYVDDGSTYDVQYCDTAGDGLELEIGFTSPTGGNNRISKNVSGIEGEMHTGVENAGDGVDNVATYLTLNSCLNAIASGEVSSESEQPSDNQYGTDDYRQYYEDNSSVTYFARITRFDGQSYSTCHEITSTGPAVIDTFDFIYEIEGVAHSDVGGTQVDLDGDGEDEAFTQGFPFGQYRMYVTAGQTDSNVSYYDSLSPLQTLYLVREKDISSGSGSDQTVNVGRVTGEAYTDLENAGSRIEVYGVFDNITGVISDLRSSETVQPSDAGGVDYTQYFEAAQSSFDSTDYYIRALGNSSGTVFETTGNPFTTTSLAATVDLVTDKGGTVVDEITRVAIDYDQDGVDEASTAVIANDYHLWTTTDGDGVDISFYDGSNNKLFETSLNSLGAGLVDIDVSVVEGDVPAAFVGETFELNNPSDVTCDATATYDTGVVSAGSPDYRLYFVDNGTVYHPVYCDTTADGVELRLNFTSPTGGNNRITRDVASVQGEAHTNLEASGDGADNIDVCTDEDCTDVVSSEFEQPADTGSEDYLQYFWRKNATSDYFVRATMNDGNVYVTNGNQFSSVSAGSVITGHDLDSEITGDVHSGVLRIGIDNDPDTGDEAWTTSVNSNEYHLFVENSDSDGRVNFYDDTTGTNNVLYVDGDYSGVSTTRDVAKITGTIDPTFSDGASGTIDVFGDWADNAPTVQFNTISFVSSDVTDNYSVYVNATGGILKVDLRTTDVASLVGWFMNVTDGDNSIDGADEITINLDNKVSGEVPTETDGRITIEDNNATANVLYGAAVDNANNYAMYVADITTVEAPLEFRFYENGYTGTELLRRTTDSSPNINTDETFNVAKFQGDLEDGFRDAGFAGETVDVFDNYLTQATNYGDAVSDDSFITNTDSYEEWFEVGNGLASVDIQLIDIDGYVSYVHEATDAAAFGVTGGNGDNTIDPAETLTLDLSHKVSGAIPADVDYAYVFDDGDLLTVAENNTGMYTMYVSPDWTADSTFDYAVDNFGVHDAIYVVDSLGIELLRDSLVSAFTGNELFNVSKISGGLDADFEDAGTGEVFQVIDDWNATTANFNQDGDGTDYFFINSKTDDDASEEYEVYFENEVTTPYDLLITEDDSSVTHTYYMDDVDEAAWGLAGNGISVGETQDWDLTSEKSGTITEEAWNQALEFVEISFRDNDGVNTGSSMGTDLQIYTETESDGTYAVYTIPKFYDIEFRKPGFVKAYDDELNLTVDVTPNDKELQYTVRINLTDHQGQPLNATVWVFNTTNQTAPIITAGVPAFVANPLTSKILPNELYYFPVLQGTQVGMEATKDGWLTIIDPDPENDNAVLFNVSEDYQQILSSTYFMINVQNDPVQLSFPISGETLPTATPTLSWVDQTGELGYFVQIDDTDATFGSLVVDENLVADTTLHLPTLTDGTYYWRVQAYDGVTDAEWSETRTFTLDTTPPTIDSVTSQDADQVYQNSDTISVLVDSDGTGYTVTADFSAIDSEYSAGDEQVTDNDDDTYTVTYTISNDNTNSDASGLAVAVSVTDDQGNGPTADSSLTLELNNPVSSVSFIDPQTGDIFDDDVVVTLTAPDNTDKITLSGDCIAGSVDLTDAEWNYTWALSSCGSGDKTIIAVAFDTDSNSLGSDSITVTVDLTAPTINSVTSQDADQVYQNGDTISILVDSDGTGYTITADFSAIDSEYSAGDEQVTDNGDDTYTVTYTISNDNTNADASGLAISVSVTDAQGNGPSIDNSLTLTLNNPVGSVSITSPDNNLVVTDDVLVTISAPDDTNTIEITGDCVVGTVTLTSAEWEYDWEVSTCSDGDQTLTVEAFDTDGNSLGLDSVTVELDTSATITVSNPASPVSGVLEITATTDSDVEDVVFEYSPDSGANWFTIGTDDTTPFSIAWDTTSVGDGSTYMVRATATDSVNNQISDASTIFEIDNGILGVPTLQEPVDTAIVSSAPTLDWNSVADATDYYIQLDDNVDFSSPIVDTSNADTDYDTSGDGLVDNTVYYWHVAARDVDGDLGQYSSTWTFEIDSIGPDAFDIDDYDRVSGTVEYEVSNLAASDIELVEFIITDGDAEFTFATDSDAPFEAALDTTEYADGDWDVFAVAYDFASNDESSDSDTITIDNAAPTMTVNQAFYGPFNADPASNYIDVDFADDGDITAEYKIGADGTWVTIGSCDDTASPCTDDWSVGFGSLSEGENDIFIRASDDLDNEEQFVEIITILVDTVEPGITFVTPTQDQATADDFTVLVHTDEVATCSWDLNSGEDSDGFSTTGDLFHEEVLSSLNDGANSLDVTCTDEAGNDETISVSWTVVSQDAFVASTSLSEVYSDSSPDIGGIAIHPGILTIDAVEYFIREISEERPSSGEYGSGDLLSAVGDFDSTFESFDGIIDFSSLDDGEYVIYIHASAGGGWSDLFETKGFTLDTTDPVIFNVSPSGDIQGDEGSTDVLVSFQTSEPTDCTVDGDDATGAGSIYHEFELSGLSDGDTSYDVECEDRAGLTSDITVDLNLDSNEPSAELDSLDEFSPASFLVSWSGSDDNTGVAFFDVDFNLNGNGWEDWFVATENTQAIFAAEQGDEAEFRVRATDGVGNIGEYSDTVSTVVDAQPPVVTEATPSGIVSDADVTLEVTTDEDATCEFSDEEFEFGAGTEFDSTGGLLHTHDLGTLDDGDQNYFVRCEDDAGNHMIHSAVIDFDVDTRLNFAFTEELTPTWDSFFLPKLVLDDILGTATSHDPEIVLASLEDGEGGFNYEIVWYFDGTVWLKYVPTAPDFLNNLEFNDEISNPYWIKMNTEDRLEIDE